MDLTIRIGDLELENPFMVAAGPPGVTGASLKRMASGKPGAVVTKSIGVVPSPGQRLSLSHKNRDRYSLVLTDPWSAHTFEEWCETEIAIAKEGGVPVIVNLQAVTNTPAEDIARMAPMAVEAGADAIELSAFGSAPNVVDGSGIGAVQTAKRTYEVIRAAKKAVKVPVIGKLLPEPSNLIDLIKAVEEGGADAIASRDTIFPAISFDIYTRRPRVARTVGNWMPELSGRAILETAIGYVVEIRRRTSLPIIGIGGVKSWSDAVEMIIAGATGVGVCTAAMVEGPKIFPKLTKGLNDYLDDQGISMEELRGAGLEGIRQVNEMALQPLLVEIDKELCNQCGICETVCPVQAVRRADGYNYIVTEECIKCAFCVNNCPENAIQVSVA
ncbi:MAG: 4Fe-4S binding protein [Anaerolineales bacterium]|nr:4Fe-4S binding protein [Anaerolineales bacterium]